MADGFKHQRSLPISYNDQGAIYFECVRYLYQPERVRERIDRICHEAARGGNHEEGLRAFLTTSASFNRVCMAYYLSTSTLDRLRKKFYLLYDSERRALEHGYTRGQGKGRRTGQEADQEAAGFR